MKLSHPIPIVRSFDEPKAKEFYVAFLGFNVDWEHRFEANTPLYMQVSKDDCILHISEHHGDASPGAALRVEVEGLDAYQQELLAKKYKNSRPGIIEQPWGRDMCIADPFGNRLIFCHLNKHTEP
jgi:catechol 2,3-dioxygenase-like lactoylglutathione lyase family enzyme